MPNFKITTAAKRVALALKIAGALLLAVATHPIVAFTTLIAGSLISATIGVRQGEHAAASIDGAFVVANIAGIARSIGLLG
jgi:uncharacterized membrane protein